MNICSRCGKICVSDGCGTGYGKTTEGAIVCYDCCGKEDKKSLLSLKKGEKYYLYLSDGHLTNWPGTLKIKVTPKIGRHNMAGVRRDVWFSLEDKNFHGVQYGDMSEICYIQAVG